MDGLGLEMERRYVSGTDGSGIVRFGAFRNPYPVPLPTAKVEMSNYGSGWFVRAMMEFRVEGIASLLLHVACRRFVFVRQMDMRKGSLVG